MGFFDDIFGGGIFDFNGDGKTTWDEEALAFMIFQEVEKENSDDSDQWNCDDFEDDF